MAGADVIVVAVSLLEVGRTGAAREDAGVVVIEVAGQEAEAQARSVGQQPPPREAGQDW